MSDHTDHEDQLREEQLPEEERSEDQLLGELARTGAEEDEIARERLDERWDRLSSGELSEQEVAELRALAEESEEGRRAFEAFRPLEEDFYQRVGEQAREALAVESEEKAEEPSAAADPRSPESPVPIPVRAGGPWASRRSDPWPMAIAASVLVVACLGIWWGMRARLLPEYSVEGLTGSSSVRGVEVAQGECPTYNPGDTVEILLRPATAVEGLGYFYRAKCADSPDTSESYRFAPPFGNLHAGVTENGVVHLTGMVREELPEGGGLCPAEPGKPEVWTICLGAMRASGEYHPEEVCARAPLGKEPVAQGKATVLKTHLCIQRPTQRSEGVRARGARGAPLLDPGEPSG